MANRKTPEEYAAYCKSKVSDLITIREDLLNQLAALQSQIIHWAENSQEAEAELDAEQGAKTLDDSLGYGKTGPLVEFEGDAIDEVAAL